MKQDREKMSRTGYSFISNAAWHWREQFTREPKAAASVLLLSFVAICLPLLNARLPKLVLQGLEERWELRRFAAVLLLLVAVLAVANMLQAALKPGVRLDVTDSRGHTPLDVALTQGNAFSGPVMVHILLRHGVRPGSVPADPALTLARLLVTQAPSSS